MRDVERVESQMEGLRSAGTQRGDHDLDLAKKMMLLERDVT